MTSNGNGQAAQAQNPFRVLENATYSLSTARTKQEASARLANCLRIEKTVEQIFGAMQQQIQYMLRLVLEATGGKLLKIVPPVGTWRVTDVAGSAMHIIDGQAGFILQKPENEGPITVHLQMPDGTEETKVIQIQDELPPEPEKRLVEVS